MGSVLTKADFDRVAIDPPAAPLALLFAPDRAMLRQARTGHVLWLLLFAWVASLLLAAAVAYRVDATHTTLQKLEQSGQLQGLSDRQLADETRKAERVFQVLTVAKGAVSPPLQLGAASLAILGISWFLRGRVRRGGVAPVAAATLLPGAIGNLLEALTAFRHAALPPEGAVLAPRTVTALLQILGHPLVGAWAKLGNVVDFFSLWAALLLGFGVVALTHLPKRTALLGTFAAWLCYRLLTQVAVGG